MIAPGKVLAAIREQFPATRHMPADHAVQYVRDVRRQREQYWHAVQRGNEAMDRAYERDRYRSET